MTHAPTVHERLMLAELLRLESIGVQTTKAIVPIVGDDELRAETDTCVQTGQNHLRTLIDFCSTHGLAHEGGA